MSKRLVLLDGHAIAYRAYFALTAGGDSRWQTSFGEPTAGTYGFACILLRVLEDERPDYLAVAFDVGKTFRNELHPEYKGTRAKMPDDMRPQLDRMRELVDVFGFPRLEREGFEADDLLGSAAFEAAENGIDVKIITGDRDLLQLVTDQITVDLSGGRLNELKAYGPAEVKSYLGVRPDQVVDYKALVGDPSDNYCGVPGIGPKTAVALLERFETLDGVYANLEEIKGAARKKLEANRESAILSRELAQIRTDLNVEIDYNAANVTRAPYPAVDKFFRMMEFRTLIPRLKSVAAENQLQNEDQPLLFGAEPTAANGTGAVKLEHCATETVIVDDDEKLTALTELLSGADVIALDTETTGTDAMAAELVGISFSVKPDSGYYVPVGHNGGRQLPIEHVREALNPILADRKIRKTGHNIKYDLIVLTNFGFTVQGEIFDTMIAGWVLDPASNALGLKSMARVILDSEMTTIDTLIGKGKNQISMADVPIEAAAPYAAADADNTLRLEEPLRNALEARSAMPLYRSLEMPLIPVLIEMERRGIRVDVEALNDLSRVFGARLIEIEKAIYDSVGYPFNINSTQQLSVALFQELKLDPPPNAKKTTAGLYSTAADVLEEMSGMHPVIDLILENREIAKLKSTYVDALPLAVHPLTGRVHTSFNQAGTVTGRLASSSPNLQNIPTRTELGRKVRAAFIPEEGWTLLSVDYSQIELRIIAHLSQDENMLSAFRAGQDIHSATAAAIYGVSSLSEVTKEMRRHAKAINFGLIYGMSSFGLSRSTSLSRQDAGEFVKIYFRRFPRIQTYLDALKNQAGEQGFVETMMGRRRYFPNLRTQMNRNLRAREEREAINAPIQGSAADIMKKAMIALHGHLNESKLHARLLLQVHDELMLECPLDELTDTRRLVQETMESAVELSIPLTTEARSGANWGELEAIDA